MTDPLPDPAYARDILVEPQWLQDRLEDPGIRIVDLRVWPILLKSAVFVEKQETVREAVEQDYLDGHIPGAVLMDPVSHLQEPSLDDVALTASPERFTETMERFGIGQDTLVVMYDDSALPVPAARLWWTLQYYGHARAKILTGGLLQWMQDGRPLHRERERIQTPRVPFSPTIDHAFRATKETVFAALDDPSVTIVDAMSYEFYTGASPHPWSVRPGRIPGALCLPWLSLALGYEPSRSKETRMRVMGSLDPLHFLPASALRSLFTDVVGIPRDRRIIVYCGKGYAAPTVCLGMTLAGLENVAVYDGGLAEWSRDPVMPMEGYDGERIVPLKR